MSEIKGPVRVFSAVEDEPNGYTWYYLEDMDQRIVAKCSNEGYATTIRDALNAQEKLRADLADAIKRIPPTGNDYFGNDNTAKMYMDKCAELYELEARHAEAVRLLEDQHKLWKLAKSQLDHLDNEFGYVNFMEFHDPIGKIDTYLEAEKGASNANS